MKLTSTRIRVLQTLAAHDGSILWDKLGGVGKTASAYLREHKLAELSLDATATPSIKRLNIADAGRAALANT